MGVGVPVEDAAVVRRRPKTATKLSRLPTIETTKSLLVLPIVAVAPAQPKVSRLVQEAHSLVFARMPGVRIFGLRVCSGGRGKPTHDVEFETWVGVADVEFDGEAVWSSVFGGFDDDVGDMPGSIFDESIAMLFL